MGFAWNEQSDLGTAPFPCWTKKKKTRHFQFAAFYAVEKFKVIRNSSVEELNFLPSRKRNHDSILHAFPFSFTKKE